MENAEKFTEDDYLLFHEIAVDIKNHPSDYQEAGKWLDEYCTKDSFRERTKERIKFYEDYVAGQKHYSHANPNYGFLELYRFMLEADLYMPISHLIINSEEMCIGIQYNMLFRKSMGEYMSVYTWADTTQSLLSDWYGSPHLGGKSARRVLLMTWLMTEQDIESTGLCITKFENVAWEKRSCYSSEIFVYNQFTGHTGKQWMEAIHVAWRIVNKDRKIAEPLIKTDKKSGRSNSTKDSKSNILGMTTEEAEKKTIEYVNKNGFIPIKKLAKVIGCAPATMYKAIKNSLVLKQARREYDAKRKSKRKTLSAVNLSNNSLAIEEQNTEIAPEILADKNLIIEEILKFFNVSAVKAAKKTDSQETKKLRQQAKESLESKSIEELIKIRDTYLEHKDPNVRYKQA